MDSFTIIEYQDKYKEPYCNFKKEFINIDWTDKLFNDYVNNFKINKDNYVLLVLNHLNKVVGAMFCEVKNNQIYIHEIEISKLYQNNGLGRKLLDTLKARFRNYDIELSVEKDNTNAINFYLKNGFQIVSSRGKCYIMRTNLKMNKVR